MPRNDSAGKMSAGYNPGGSISADRVQPGRVMLILRDALVDDELVYQIALQAGEVKSVHRPQANRQMVFVQYENPGVAEQAIAMMKNLPIFKAVDPAIKSERFVKEKSDVGGSNMNNNYNDDQQQRNSSMNNQMNKGSGNRQQRGGNNSNNNKSNKNNNNSMNGGGNYGDVNLMTMDFDSPQRSQPRNMDTYQPKFSLGCWSCTKMPSYECRCGAFYCDVECQRADWPVHKDICMPRLVPISYSNNRILQEALSASLHSSGSPFAQSPRDSSQSQQQHQQKQPQQQQQQRQQPQNQQKQQQQQPQKQQQQNQNNRQRGQTKGNQSPPDQQQKQSHKQESPRPSAPAPKQRQMSPKSSPEENSPTEKVSRLGTKLQRLKIAKSGSGAVSRGILQAGPFPREGAMVKITASLPSGVIYIYHNNGKDGQQSDYYLLTNRMYKAANEAGPLKEVPSVDDVIFAPFLGGYYRAKVLAVNGEKLQVFYVDFGNIDKVEWKESREIADEGLKWAKYLTYPVMLEGVETFSGEMLKLLETLEHVEEFEMVKANSMSNSEMKSVVLKRLKKSLTLNMELMEVQERVLRERQERERERLEKEKKAKQEQPTLPADVDVEIADPSNYKPVLFDESMETSQLTCGTTKKLLIIDASEVLETRIISVVAAENARKYTAILEHCSFAGVKDSNVYKPVEEGEVCLVFHQDDWSRALYDISDGSYMLLDVGIITSVPAANVRRFPPQLSHMVYNNEVFVENLPKLKAMMTDGKPDSIHGALIEAKIAASDDGISISLVDA